MPTVTLGSIAHAAQTALYGRSTSGLDWFKASVSAGSEGVHGDGGFGPTTRMVLSTSAPLRPIATPWFGPDAGQSSSNTSVTPSPIRKASSPTLIFLSLSGPGPPKR